MPRIILTFLDSYNFEGKKIIPFCTSDKDGIEVGLDKIKNAVPDAEWQEGQRSDGTAEGSTEAFAGEKAPFEDGNNNGVTDSAESSTTATTTNLTTTSTTKKQDSTTTTQQSPSSQTTTEPTTVTTTLVEHDTPYIPIP